MPWDLNWPLAAGADYNGSRVVDNVDVAHIERGHVYGSPTRYLTITGSHHTIGDDLQRYPYLATCQNEFDSFCIAFIDPRTNYAGGAGPATPFDWYWTTATLRSAAGINAAGWHAEYPKSILGDTATVLTDGDAPVNGDRVLNDADGRVYDRVAGAWVLVGNVGEIKPDVKTAHRVAQAGDFLNRSTLNEIYAAANLLKWGMSAVVNGGRPFATVAPGGGFASRDWSLFPRSLVNNTGLRSTASTGYDNWADAMADALAQYNAGIGVDPTVVLDVGIWTGGTVSFDPAGDPALTTYSADLGCARSKFRVTPDAANLVSVTTEFYTRVDDSPLGSSDLIVTLPRIFDANGADVLYHVWHRFDSVGPGNAAQTSVFLGQDFTTYTPNWCPAPVDDGLGHFYGIGTQGYRFNESNTGVLTILKFDVAGGFSMVA